MRDPFSYENPTKLFVKDHICAPNGWDLAQTRLEIPLNGRRSVVRLVVGPEDQRLILRIFVGKRRLREARRLHAVNDILETNSIPTPRHLRWVSDFGGPGAMLLEEEHIRGHDLFSFPRTPETLRALASTLARLHSVRSPQHGDCLSPKSGGFAKAFLKRFPNRMKSLRAPIPHRPTRAERRELLAWARAWKGPLDRLPLHSLVHDKLNPYNLMVTSEPRALLLDVLTVQWGSPSKDMAQLRHESFDGDEASWNTLFDHYQELVGPEIADEIRTFLPLFEAYYFLAEAAVSARRLHRVRRGRSTAVVKMAPAKIQRFWGEAMNIVRTVAPPSD